MAIETRSDTRAHPRYVVNAFADVIGSDVLLYQRIQDLSLGGLRLRGGSLLDDVGNEVDVTLNFPELDSELSLTGTVTWATREPQSTGIRFELDEVDRARLEGYLDVVKHG